MMTTLKKTGPTPWPHTMQVAMTIAAALYGILFSLSGSPFGFWIGGFMAGIHLFNRRYTPIMTGFAICFVSIIILAIMLKSPWVCIMWAIGILISRIIPNG